MSVTVEILSGLERKIGIKAPQERIDQEVEKRLKEVASKFKMPGFRAGKAPLHVLRQRFGTSIRYEVIEKVIESTYKEAISQEKLTPAGMPIIEITRDKQGEPLEYYATIEIYPEVKLRSLDSVELENIKVDITQKDVDEMIHKLRRQRAKWVAVDRPSQKGDRVTVSYEGRQNGELFEGGTGKNIPLDLGSGTTIPGFEEGFTGHKAGDSVVVNVTFPAEYPVASLAGKPAEFKGTVHKVEMPELPPLDEEFAKQLGVKEGGMEQLRASVLENMQNEVAEKVQGHLKGQILEKLLELHPLDLPKVLIEEEIKRLQEQEQSYMSQMTGGAKQAMSEPREELRQLAKRRVHLGIVFSEIMEQQKFTPEPERIEKLIRQITASYENPDMVAQVYRENKQMYRQLEEKVKEDQLIDYMINQAKQIEKAMKYSEFKGFKPAQED